MVHCTQAWGTVYAIYNILLPEANIAIYMVCQRRILRHCNILYSEATIYCRKEIAYFDIYIQLYILCQIWSYFYLQYCVYKHTHTSICLYMYILVHFIHNQRHLSSRIRQDKSHILMYIHTTIHINICNILRYLVAIYNISLQYAIYCDVLIYAIYCWSIANTQCSPAKQGMDSKREKARV